MKKLLACVLSILLTAAAVPAVSAEGERPLLYTPVNDGVITAEEWGEPDHVLEPGDAAKPKKIEYWWRYNSTGIYFAVRVHTDNFKNGTHDAGGSYLIPRIQTAEEENVTYMGLISLDENNEVFLSHLSKIGNRTCGARVTEGAVEMEFAFPIYISYSQDDVDYLRLQLDYHEPKEIKTALSAVLAFSDEAARLPAPAETDPPVTAAPDTTPPAEDTAPPADSAGDPAPAPAAAPRPAMIIGIAAGITAAIVAAGVHSSAPRLADF